MRVGDSTYVNRNNPDMTNVRLLLTSSMLMDMKMAASADTHAGDGSQAASLPRVLVVDDEAFMFAPFRRALPPSSYAITFVEDGHEALKVAAAHKFDLAFVDYFLAELNGAEIAHKMRDLQPKMKTVLMSCYSDLDQSAKLELAGASAFLAKPMYTAEFSSEIVRVAEELLPAQERQRMGG